MNIPTDPSNDYDLRRPFKLTGIHTHYTCHCSPLNVLRLKPSKEAVAILVHHKCPDHIGGTATEVVFGDRAVPVQRCPHPGCDCNEITMMLPFDEFYRFLVLHHPDHHQHQN